MTKSYRAVSLTLALCAAVALIVPAAAQSKTASQFYIDYRAAFDKATKIDDVLPYMSKQRADQVAATPADERAKMFEMIKMIGAITEVKILKETKTAEGATLTVEALDPDKKKTTGTVKLVKEGGAWKLDGESWSSSS
jgi:Domain of unknown function (DUF4878)